MTRNDRDHVRALWDQLTDVREQIEIVARKYAQDQDRDRSPDLVSIALPSEADMLHDAAERVREAEEILAAL